MIDGLTSAEVSQFLDVPEWERDAFISKLTPRERRIVRLALAHLDRPPPDLPPLDVHFHDYQQAPEGRWLIRVFLAARGEQIMSECKECDGTGQEEDVEDYTSTVDCWICKGSGQVVTVADLFADRLEASMDKHKHILKRLGETP